MDNCENFTPFILMCIFLTGKLFRQFIRNKCLQRWRNHCCQHPFFPFTPQNFTCNFWTVWNGFSSFDILLRPLITIWFISLYLWNPFSDLFCTQNLKDTYENYNFTKKSFWWVSNQAGIFFAVQTGSKLMIMVAGTYATAFVVSRSVCHCFNSSISFFKSDAFSEFFFFGRI